MRMTLGGFPAESEEVDMQIENSANPVRILNDLALIDVFRLLHEFRLGAVSWLRRFRGDRE